MRKFSEFAASGQRLRRALLLALGLGGALAARAQADLTLLSLEQLLEVSVTGASKYAQKQSEVAAAVSVITRQEIQVFGWRSLDEALASLPGIHLSYDRQYNYVGTRGLGLPGDFNTRLLVTIDGNRFNDPTFDAGPFGAQFPLDMDLIERIEFIPGPGGAVYGQNAMFGVVNVVTRSGAAVDGTELALAWQQPQALGAGRASWGGLLAGVDVLVSASGLHARGEDRFFDFGAAGVSGVAAGLDGERDREFFVRASRGPWSASLVHGDHRKDDPTGVFKSDPLVPGQFEGDRYTVGQLQYQDSFAGDSLQLSGRLFAGRHRYSSMLSFEGALYDFPAIGTWHGLEVRALSTALANHKLMLGLEAQDNVHHDPVVSQRLS